MKKFLQKKLNDQKGMTLIELLAVIVIIAIIAAIAIPAIGNIIENSRYSAIKADAVNILSASDIYYADGNTGATVTIEALTTAGYLEDAGSFGGGTFVTKAIAGAASTPADISGDAKVGNVELTFDNVTRDAVNELTKDNLSTGITVTAP
ncbi:prepilin-type N-terminal cleavage/methylation domain-containing protein [Planococcus shenhongbingii]|uniref:Prepilin-type N-terminal cleavage/methylation domain-containing protein n=1 Tax=Planococcus shenhongbingii TaxID=3058398 RepID=A0ABT8NDB0_9BACL|nr:prepilin-type N-terminal cleavage/methylation domain-containing protein [Planococcus sp. N017]MDN7245882.1 prepilin-type N-terminal cleavage/methylation domain-containing protein [Planococcus sp. N017]